MNKNTTILFDLDGTLLDSLDSILESFKTALENINHADKYNTERVTNLIGLPLPIMFEGLGVPRELSAQSLLEYKNHYTKIKLEKTTLMEGTKEALELASDFANLGVVTTKVSTSSLELLEHLGISHYFKALVGADNVTNPKPHPEPILKCMQMLGATDKASTWMIGDTHLDTQSAYEAGVRSIGLSCGYGSEDKMKKYTQHIQKNPKKAIEFIINLK